MLHFNHVSLYRGGRPLLDDVEFTLHPGWKCGITGANGAGKSTLLALVRQELRPDRGIVQVPGSWTLAFVEQESPAGNRPAIDVVLDGDHELRKVESALETVRASGNGLEEANLLAQLDAMDAWTARARAARLLYGLGFTPDDEQRPVSSFSGGWRMRLNLARALMCRSDLLLLDEPTNHLDLDAVLWLETWLRQYRGTLFLIAHDRDFLDRVADHILHLEASPGGTHAQLYSGNYSDFERLRSAQRLRQQADFERQQREVAHLRNFVDRFRAKATKARQAQSRLKRLERMPELAPAHIDSPFHFEFRPAARLPSPLLQLNAGSAGYGQQTVLADINLSLMPGDRLGLLGPNGAGKSTLIRVLAGAQSLTHGERLPARDLRIGYFAQHQLEQLRLDDTPLQLLARLDPQAREQDLRDFLGGFGFRDDRVLEPVAPFSGGEKARLVLAWIVYQQPNLLLLDEPTNHLDLEMRHALTVALQDFDGALVVVSHDRFLLESVTDQLIRIADGSVAPYDGNLDDYAQWLADRRQRQTPIPDPAATGPSRKDQRRQGAEQRRRVQPLKTRMKQLESELDRLGREKLQIDQQLADNTLYAASEKSRLTSLLREQANLQKQLTETEATWLELCEALENAGRE